MTGRKKIIHGISLSIFLTAGIPYITLAEGDTAEKPFLEEVIVTAQKREQSIMDVPMSITALSEQTLEALSADDFADFQGTVPGVAIETVSGAGGPQGGRAINIRGISATAGANTVGFYINQTPIRFNDPRLFDVNRVEVLRGPQGTLYGALSMGGTIRVIMNQPDSSAFKAKFDGSLSDTDNGGANVAANAMLNFPIIKDLFGLRVTLMHRDESGYIDNILGEANQITSAALGGPIAFDNRHVQKDSNTENLKAARVTFLITPNEKLTITPSVFYQKLELGGQPASIVIPDFININDPGTSRLPLDQLGKFTTHRPFNDDQYEEFTLSDLTIDYDFGWGELTSSTSFYDYENLRYTDTARILPQFFGPGAPGTAMADLGTQEQFTQEVRLATDYKGRFNWIIGGFYTENDSTFKQNFSIPGFNDLLFGGIPVIPNDIFFTQDTDTETNQKAFFGELYYDLTEAINITVGLRWFELSWFRNRRADGLFNGGPQPAPGGPPVITDAKETDVTPRLVVSYDISEQGMIYATASKGFRPGFGLSSPPNTCDDDLRALGKDPDNFAAQVDSDSLWNYEIGGKGQFLDNRVSINAAAYILKWQDIQQGIALSSCGFSLVDNSGEATSKGFELEVAAQPIDGLVLTGAVGYVKAQLDQDAPSLGAVNGDNLVNVPEWKFALSGTYNFPIKDELEGYVRLDFQHESERTAGFDFSNAETSFLNSRPEYQTLSGRIGVYYKDWEFALFAHNLTNEDAPLAVFRFLVPDYKVVTHRPRTIGFNVRTSF